ncbi:MAG: nucleotidyl transferase AbiEii/AbiGii toxin family protein [Candidatus Omnitrophica bacterium]|nr:nucleotidyl transferase AbiEii/AbiGii toxin family protein [Candidatus Omnitrophota bacterium]
MNKQIRQAQKIFLKVFAENASLFALAGGTALELYYLNHRFSVDLDFFSPRYDIKEIDKIISSAQEVFGFKIILENEFTVTGKARVRFYTVDVKDTDRPLKIDFVEDVLLEKPIIKKFKKVSVYSVEDIYYQKIIAISGIVPQIDEIGRQIIVGRRKARDVFDLYKLSKEIKPLSEFLKDIPQNFQRGIVYWYRTFSRREFQLDLLDLDIYEKKIDSKEIIIYLENQIKKFITEEIE